jgi:hypothetical protein
MSLTWGSVGVINLFLYHLDMHTCILLIFILETVHEYIKIYIYISYILYSMLYNESQLPLLNDRQPRSCSN